MDTAEKTFQALVEAGLEPYDGKPFAAERALDLPQDSIRSLFRGDRKAGTSLNRAKEICDALGLELYIGPPRQPADTPAVDPASDPAFALVPAYDIHVAAGDGTAGVEAFPDRHFAFRKEWLSRIGVSAANAVLVRAKGDSMQPIIWNGDTLLVDRSKTVPHVRAPGKVSLRKGYQDDVYVIERDGDLRVKAVRRPAEDKLILISENSARYDPDVVQGDDIAALRIVGQVMWWGHTAGGTNG